MNLYSKWTATAAALVCVVGNVSAANHVDSLNQEWLPLTTVTNFSWAEIDGVCQSLFETPGACNGSLGGTDLTGWTWASRVEVNTLIGEFMVAAGDLTPPINISSGGGYGTMGFNWGQAVIAAMGTTAPSVGNYTLGFTNGGRTGPGDYSWLCAGGPCVWDSYAAANDRFGGKSEFWGGWFYRAAVVPEPSSMALMLAGAALLVGLQRRRGKRGN